MPGLGLTAVGSTPFGVGTPVSGAAPPVPATVGARFLSPRTRDYEQGPTGHLAQMPPVRQRVLLALLTVRGSSTALPAFGLKMPAKITETFAVHVRYAVRDALRKMTDVDRVLRVDGIDVVRIAPAGRILVTVSYADLTTGERGAEQVEL